MSRAAILMFALLAMHLMLGLLVLAVARGERSSKALRLWGWGLVSYAAGAVFFVAPYYFQADLRQVVGNGFITLAALLTGLGIYSHTQVRLSRSWVVASFTAVMLILSVNHILGPRLIVDIATPTLYASSLYVAVAGLLLWHPVPDAKAASRFMALSIIATLAVWNVRLAAIWVSLGGTQDPARADLIVSLFAIGQMLCLVSATLGLVWIEVRLMEADLRRSAFTDLLTGLPNRRAMTLRFEEEIARCKRLKQKFGLVLFDIDHFKQINDSHGHYVGDDVLRHIAAALDQAKRAEDVLGRIGGEEFLVILPHHEREASRTAAERLRCAVEAARPADGATPGTTVSGGVALYPDDGEDWDKLYVAVDRRMYRAKHAGRNRVEAVDA